jgi:hypothetical protein
MQRRRLSPVLPNRAWTETFAVATSHVFGVHSVYKVDGGKHVTGRRPRAHVGARRGRAYKSNGVRRLDRTRHRRPSCGRSQEIADLIEEKLAGRPARPTRTSEDREPPYRWLPDDELWRAWMRQIQRKREAVEGLADLGDTTRSISPARR